MAQAKVIDGAGSTTQQRDLPEELFGGTVNPAVLHQVVTAQRAAARAGSASTKTRSEVRGGGQKPWRQKGTGRARHGSIRSPLWVGGGVAHGPKPRDYEQRVPKKMKRLALRSALTDRARQDRIRVVDGLSFDGPSTKAAVDVLDALDVGGLVLLVLAGPDEVVEKSFRNLSHVRMCYPGNLGTHEVLYADWVVFTKDALGAVTG
jgi:large subunit ribosomal protein L4